MKILYWAGVDLTSPQGHAAHIRHLCEALEHRGHRVRLLAPRPEGPLAWEGPAGGLRFASRLRLPRLRHVTSEWSLARSARREMAAFAPDLLVVRLELFTFGPLLLLDRPPLVVESNSSIPEVIGAEGAARWRVRLARTLERRMLRAARSCAIVTGQLASTQMRAYGLDAERVGLVPNGAHLPPRFDGPRGGDGRFHLLFMGNLNRMQGLETVLEAISRRPDLPLQLTIVGDGCAREPLVARVRAGGLDDRVRFLGGLPEGEAVALAQSAHLLVAPYRKAVEKTCGGEVDPLKVLQGLACDRPVLASRVAGVEIPQGAGECIAPDDPEAWGDAIRRWFQTWDDAGRPPVDWPWKEGEGPGRAYVRKARTWDHTAAAWEIVLRQAVGR